MEPAAIERVQQMINDEVRERFPATAVRRVELLQHGDDPAVEPGALMVRVLIAPDGGDKALEVFSREHMGRMREFRRMLAERLPEATALEVTVDDPGVAYDHRARWTVGGGGWLPLGGGTEDPGGLAARLDEQVKERFPDSGVQRVEVLGYGDDPVVEPGGMLVLVHVLVGGDDRERDESLESWEDANREMMDELQRELAEKLPPAGLLEFVLDSGDPGLKRRKRVRLDGPGHKGTIRLRIGGSAADLAERAHGGEMTPVMARLGPEDLETLDTLITAGIAGNRAQALRWALARIRERPAYAKLIERTRELEELKTQF
jgi:hypothetical protein